MVGQRRIAEHGRPGGGERHADRKTVTTNRQDKREWRPGARHHQRYCGTYPSECGQAWQGLCLSSGPDAVIHQVPIRQGEKREGGGERLGPRLPRLMSKNDISSSLLTLVASCEESSYPGQPQEREHHLLAIVTPLHQLPTTRGSILASLCNTHTHTRTHARTHARTHI